MDRSPALVWTGLQASVALLVFGFFLFSFGSGTGGGFLSPFVLFWVLIVALHPFRGRPGHTLLASLAAALALLWLLRTTGLLLAPFILALVLAYILDPLVDRVEGKRVGRSMAILLLTLPVVVALALAILFGLPALASETGDLIERIPDFLARLAGWLETASDRILRVDLPLVQEEELLARLQSVDAAAVMSFVQEQKDRIFAGIWSGVLGFGRGFGAFLTVLGYTVLTPVLTFYLLRDYDRLKRNLSELIPVQAREGVLGVAREYDRLLSRYMRGQITVALVMGAVTAVGLLVLGFPYAVLLGVLVAVFSVVPYLGLVLSLIPALFIALVSGSVGVSLLKVAVVYGGSQILEGAVISPRIVGESVGLHPVLVVLALAVGGFFLGFVGLLIAVPIAVGVKLLVERGVERYRNSEFFRGEGSETARSPS